MRWLCLVAVFAICACSPEAQSSSVTESVDRAAAPVVFQLGPALKEVSGLAAAGPDSVLTHGDEWGVFHEISLTDGSVVRTFTLGLPPLKGDFEGIAVVGDLIYAVTSSGLIYQKRRDATDVPNDYKVFNTGLGGICEIEGISPAPTGGLLLLCKRSTLSPKRDRLIIYRWAHEERPAPPEVWLNVSLKGLVPLPKKGSNKPSGLELHAQTGHVLVLDAKMGGVLELTPEGEAAGYLALGTDRHRQAEGIAILDDGSLVIADEGSKRKPGRLTIYAPKR